MDLFTIIRDLGEPGMVVGQIQDSATVRAIISLVKDGQKYIMAVRDFDFAEEAYNFLKNLIENTNYYLEEDCE